MDHPRANSVGARCIVPLRCPFVETWLGFLAVGLLLAACTSTPVETPLPLPTDAPSPTPAPITLLIQAFAEEDPDARLEAVLAETADFMRSSEAMDDAALGGQIAGAAQVAQTLAVEPAAFVRRGGDLAVIGMPGGMGIYLFDLAQPNSIPLEVAAWTLGLSAVNASWGEDAVGIAYDILAGDGRTRAHFSRAERVGGEWLLVWNSDETPLWWLCAHDAAVDVSPDLNMLVLTGQAPGLTPVFDEFGDAPRRVFRVTWVWGRAGYTPSPPPGAFETYQEWGWVVAEPSAYTTLVEFMERLRMGDEAGAGQLLAAPALGTTARELGLSRTDRRYTVVQADERTIIFRDRIGVIVVTFIPGDPWLITDVRPYGAEP